MDFVYVLLIVIAGAIALALYLGYIAASGLLAAAVAIAAYGLALPTGYLAAVGQVTALRPAGAAAGRKLAAVAGGQRPSRAAVLLRTGHSRRQARDDRRLPAQPGVVE